MSRRQKRRSLRNQSHDQQSVRGGVGFVSLQGTHEGRAATNSDKPSSLFFCVASLCPVGVCVCMYWCLHVCLYVLYPFLYHIYNGFVYLASCNNISTYTVSLLYITLFYCMHTLTAHATHRQLFSSAFHVHLHTH